MDFDGFRLAAERIVRTDMFATAFNLDPKNPLNRFVQLACGHYARTKNLTKAHCPRCQRMLDTGEDWDAFRHHGGPDDMAWPEDPCRALNEPTDMVGGFLRDVT